MKQTIDELKKTIEQINNQIADLEKQRPDVGFSRKKENKPFKFEYEKLKHYRYYFEQVLLYYGIE